MQHGGAEGLGLDLLVPGEQDLLESVPHLDQRAGRQLQPQVEVEDFDDLGQRVAQGVVQPGRQHQDAQAQRRAGQGVGHRGLHRPPALRAPVAMDRMLGHHRGDVGGNVFDQPGAHGPTGRDRPPTRRAGVERVFFVAVDVRRRRPPTAGMAGLAAGGLPPALGRRLLVDRGHPRGRGGCRTLHRLAGLLGQGEQREDDRLLALAKDRVGLLGGQLRPQERFECGRGGGIRTSYHEVPR